MGACVNLVSRISLKNVEPKISIPPIIFTKVIASPKNIEAIITADIGSI